MRSIPRTLLALGLTAVLAACSPGEPTAPPASPAAAPGIPALAETTVAVLPGTGAKPFDQQRKALAPPGWTVTVWARVPTPRLLAWTPDGQLLVSRPKYGDVLALVPGRGTAAPTQRTLLSGLNQPHGLTFDGDNLYVAESDQVDSFRYAGGAVTAKKVLVDGLPDAKSPDLRGAYSHALKSVAIGRDGAIYVSVGSTGNISAEDRAATPERATILRAPAGGGTPQTFARGVRNGTGLAVDPDGGVWTAVNNRDNVAYPYEGENQGKVLTDYVNDYPLEPLAKLTQGRDLGWPFCNPDPDLTGRTPNYANRPFIRDIQLNPDGTKLDCASLQPAEQGLAAHSAPLGLSFTGTPGLPGGYGQGALVGVHGSWNRKPPRSPEVSFFAWRGGTLGPQQTILTGFQAGDGTRWGRPVMAVQGPDGAVYVSDDYAGAIYRMAPPS